MGCIIGKEQKKDRNRNIFNIIKIYYIKYEYYIKKMWPIIDNKIAERN